jgi:alpha-glucosidase (family GH31 glycosyl hydrolase)
MDGYFYDENGNNTFLMYNIHNLYAMTEVMATNIFLTNRMSENMDNPRPLIVSRDSFVGQGQYGTIWTGDNDSKEEHMKYNINQLMHFNMFGMPFVGGDICGFGGDTADGPLCARWAQVGAFYPFMRNHYAIDKGRQEFYQYDEKYQVGMKESIRQRYSLLRYLYTCLYKSSRDGDPTLRHPIYDNPDIKQMEENEDAFMIGHHVRITANYDTNDSPGTFQSFFPKGRYVDYKTYKTHDVTDDVEYVDLYEGWNYTNIHIIGGGIVPFQESSEASNIKNTYDLLQDQMKLIIVPDTNGYAEGELFIAAGEIQAEDFQYFKMTHSNKVIQFTLVDGDPEDTGTHMNEVLEEIHIVGDPDILNSDFVCAYDNNQTYTPLLIEKVKNEYEQEYIRIYGGTNTVEFDQLDTISYGQKGVDYTHNLSIEI